MRLPSRRGDSLVELIVALVLLECLGAAALATALAVERFDRHARAGAAADASRWTEYRRAETAPACVTAVDPDTEVAILPATADRPSLNIVWRCGP